MQAALQKAVSTAPILEEIPAGATCVMLGIVWLVINLMQSGLIHERRPASWLCWAAGCMPACLGASIFAMPWMCLHPAVMRLNTGPRGWE